MAVAQRNAAEMRNAFINLSRVAFLGQIGYGSNLESRAAEFRTVIETAGSARVPS
jgi:hypothetical protein